MDCDKYYIQRRDGSYSVHFPNIKGLSLDEIKTLFSQYGDVLSVHAAGDNHSLHFVRYLNLEETINCIKGFHKHPAIRILREKSKITPSNSCEENSTQRSSGNTPVKNKFRNKRINNWNTQNSDVVSDISSTSKESWKYDNTSNCSQINDRQNRKLRESSSTLDLDQCKNDNRDVRCEIICDKEEIPELISTNDIKLRQSCSNPSKALSQKVVIIPATEVIVANIHPNFGIHYILHLFEKYEPIAVTLMKVIQSTELRYCHVYFKSPQSAMEVEEEFDNYPLSDNNLIVLRMQKCFE